MTKAFSTKYRFLFDLSQGFIRIPVWGHIPLESAVKKIINHPNFFRLRGIKQLSFVSYVFPGATHTRLEHSIGVYHLTKLIFQSMLQNPVNLDTDQKQEFLSPDNIKTLLAAALLHDLGHYPHAHLLERLQLSVHDQNGFFHHQQMAEVFLFESKGGSSIADILKKDWGVDPKRVINIIFGNKKKEPLGKIISGTLDPDKLDYLLRDAHHCAVPYASLDIWRLIESFILDVDRSRLAITEKGMASFESLIFTKYMMTRHIYWQHTVKTFGSMLKRLLQDVMDYEICQPENLKSLFYHNTDEQLMLRLTDLLAGREKDLPSHELLDMIVNRVPYTSLASIGFTREGFNNGTFSIMIPNGVMDQDAPRQSRKIRTESETIQKLNQMHHNPIYRKEMEDKLVDYLNSVTGNEFKIKPHEVLIDAPGFDSIFEYKDLMELHLYDSVRERLYPLHMNYKTMFQPQFIANFEPFAKELRVIVHPRLRKLKGMPIKEMVDILQ